MDMNFLLYAMRDSHRVAVVKRLRNPRMCILLPHVLHVLHLCDSHPTGPQIESRQPAFC